MSNVDRKTGEQVYQVQTQSDRKNPFLRKSAIFRHLDRIEDVTIKDFNRAEDYGFGKFLKGSK